MKSKKQFSIFIRVICIVMLLYANCQNTHAQAPPQLPRHTFVYSRIWVDTDGDGLPETVKQRGCENILYYYFNDNVPGFGGLDAPYHYYNNCLLTVKNPNGAFINNRTPLNSLPLDPNQVHNTYPINLTQPGTYTVLLTYELDDNGNGVIDTNENTLIDSFQYTLLMRADQATFNASQNTICSGGQVCFTTNYRPLYAVPYNMLELDFGDGSVHSFWANASNAFDPNNGAPIFDGTICGVRNTHIYINTGTTPITRICTLYVHSSCGDDATLYQPITIYPSLTVSLNPNPAIICNGQSVQLTASANIPNATYAWSKNGVAISGAIGSIYTATTTGTYTVTASAGGCSATASRNVTASTISITMPAAPIYCGTGSVTISPTINSSTAITNYKWVNNANPITTIGTSSSLSVSAAGTYSVTVTNASGCSATAAITIANNGFNVSLPPTATSCGTAVTLTPNIGLPTTTPRTYLWSNGATTATMSPTVSGTYSVTVSANGCTATASSVVTITPKITYSITTTGTICAGTLVKLGVSPACSNCSYQWSANTQGGTSNETYAMLSPTSQTYTVTITDNTTGCTATADYTQPSLDYCGGCELVTMPGSATPVPKVWLYPNQVYSVDNYFYSGWNGFTTSSITNYAVVKLGGNLVVDRNIVFNNMEFIMLNTAKITVKSPNTLTIKYSYLHACGNSLWEGIIVEPGATLILENCKIEEARKAVYALSGANVTLTNNEFNNNYSGFGTNGTTTTTFAGANIFRTTAANLKMPYDTRTVGYAGMEIGGNMAVTLTIPNCQFDKLEFGIIGTSTRLAVNGCNFSNINRQGTTPQYSGTAILVRDMRMASLRNTPLAATLVSNNTFTTCYQAGLFDDMSATVSGNMGTDLVNGFRAVRVSNNRAFSFTQNDLTLNSMQNQSDAVINTTLQTNTIQNPNPNLNSATSACYFKYGILIQGSTPANVVVENCTLRLPIFVSTLGGGCTNNANKAPAEGIRIENTVQGLWSNATVAVRNNNIKNGYVGIRMVNLSSTATVSPFVVEQNNQVYDQSVSSNASASGTGFVLDNCQNTSLFCNEVLGVVNTGVTQSNFRRLGFQVNMSTTNRMKGNFMTTTRIGMQFNGNCTSPNLIRRNTINNSLVGMEFRNSAIIGVQGVNGNGYAPGNIMNIVGTSYWSSGGVPISFVDRNSNYNPNGSPVVVNVNFVPTTALNDTLTNCTQNAILFRLAAPTEDADKATEIVNQLNEGISGSFGVPTEYMLKRDLYGLLDKDPSLLVLDPSLSNFYGEEQGENIDLYNEIQEKMKNLLSVLDNIAAQNATDEEQKELAIAAELQAKAAEVNALVPENQIEVNEKLVYLVYLQTMAKGRTDFTENEREVLTGVAEQCPFAGGAAVYQARAMLGMSGEQLQYDDQTNCALGFYKKGAEEEQLPEAINPSVIQVLNIYPNPANDIVKVEYYMPEPKATTITLTDMLGRVLSRQEVAYDSNEATVSVSNLSAGLYHLTISVEGVKVATEKISVR